MDQNRNNSNNNRRPDGERPKTSLWSALIITLALVLVFSWVFNTVRNSQYNQTTFTEFRTAMERGEIAQVDIQVDRIIYMTKEEAAKPASMISTPMVSRARAISTFSAR